VYPVARWHVAGIYIYKYMILLIYIYVPRACQARAKWHAVVPLIYSNMPDGTLLALALARWQAAPDVGFTVPVPTYPQHATTGDTPQNNDHLLSPCQPSDNSKCGLIVPF